MKKFTVKPKLTHSKRIQVGNVSEGNEFVYIGRLSEAGQLVRIDYDLSLPHVIAIFGKRGSGKSYTLGSFIEGLCTMEKGTTISTITRSKATLLFDTLGIYQWLDVSLSPESSLSLIQEQALAQKGWDIESEHLEVEIWAPKGMSSQLRKQKEFTINCADFTASDWGFLFGVDTIQDRMGQLIYDAYEKVVNEGWSDKSTNYPPQSRYTIEDLIECVQRDTELIENYHGETRRAIIQQLSVYRRNPLFQPKGKLKKFKKQHDKTKKLIKNDIQENESSEGTALTELLKPGKLSVILLHKLGDDLRFILIMSLIRKIMQHRIETSEMEKSLKILPNMTDEERGKIKEKIYQGIPPTWVVADEAQNFLPSERKTTATDILIRLVREGRNFGLSFMLTSQQPSAIDHRILAQVDTLMVHKLTVQNDIEYIRRNLKSALPKEVKFGNNILSFDDLMRSLDIGQALLSNTEADRSFIIEVRPRISIHGGFGI